MSNNILIRIPFEKIEHVWKKFNLRYEPDSDVKLHICWDGLKIPVSSSIDINFERFLTFYFKNEYKDQALKFKLMYC